MPNTPVTADHTPERRHKSRRGDGAGNVTLKDLRDELDDRMSFRKNGHTWLEWSTKVFTPERLIWAAFVSAGFLFGLGGQVRDFSESIAAFKKTEPQLVQQQQVLEGQIEQTAKLLQQQQEVMMRVTDQLGNTPTKQEVADLNDRIRLSVTRQEFKAALEQQILPRLTRIERAQQPGSLR